MGHGVLSFRMWLPASAGRTRQAINFDVERRRLVRSGARPACAAAYNYRLMEISHVRNQLKHAMERARNRAQQRRQRTSEAERAYDAFLQDVAIPLTRQLANALKAEGYAFTVFTPGGGLRLASDRGRDDYVELALDTSGDLPQVVARISQTRGSRTLADERPIRKDASPAEITEADVLEFWIDALEPWLER
jgi:hypothetical protein